MENIGEFQQFQRKISNNYENMQIIKNNLEKMQENGIITYIKMYKGAKCLMELNGRVSNWHHLIYMLNYLLYSWLLSGNLKK